MATKLLNWFIIYFTCFTIPLWTAVCDVLMLFWLVDCHVEKGSLLCHVDKYLKLKTNLKFALGNTNTRKQFPELYKWHILWVDLWKWKHVKRLFRRCWWCGEIRFNSAFSLVRFLWWKLSIKLIMTLVSFEVNFTNYVHCDSCITYINS